MGNCRSGEYNYECYSGAETPNQSVDLDQTHSSHGFEPFFLAITNAVVKDGHGDDIAFVVARMT
jgi:hypothetical protein